MRLSFRALIAPLVVLASAACVDPTVVEAYACPAGGGACGDGLVCCEGFCRPQCGPGGDAGLGGGGGSVGGGGGSVGGGGGSVGGGGGSVGGGGGSVGGGGGSVGGGGGSIGGGGGSIGGGGGSVGGGGGSVGGGGGSVGGGGGSVGGGGGSVGGGGGSVGGGGGSTGSDGGSNDKDGGATGNDGGSTGGGGGSTGGGGGSTGGGGGTIDAGPPDAGVVLLFSLPPEIEAGACEAVSLSRVGGSGGALTVSLTATPAHLTFSSLATCATETTSVAFATGAVQTTVYVRGRSSDSETVTVTATPAGGAASSETTIALPLVRRGRCSILNGQSSVLCPLTPQLPSPDISRTFVIYQSRASEPAPSDAVASCVLSSSVVLPAALNCSRAGTRGELVVAWQAASHGRGALEGGWTVQHVSTANQATQSFTIPLTQPVDRTSSFVIPGFATSGSNWAGNDHFSVSLGDAAVSFRMNGTLVVPNTFSAQVVEFAGSTVRHELRAGPNLPYQTPFPVGLPAAQSFALFSTAFQNDSGSSLPCRYALDVERTTSGISVSRDTTLGCTVTELRDAAMQVIGLPPPTVVQQLSLTLASTQLTGLGTLATPGLPHETLVLLPGLGAGGLTVGRTSATSGPPGIFLAHSELVSSTTFAITRGAAGFAATYRPFVLVFDP